MVGYSKKSMILKNNSKYKKLLIIAFQRRFRPQLINGVIDQECMLIGKNLAQKYTFYFLENLKFKHILCLPDKRLIALNFKEESPGSTKTQCQLTTGGGNPRDSATENKPPQQGKGEKVW